MSSSSIPADVIARAARIRLACFDVDGTLTDGGLGITSDGSEFKVFHVHDGLGLKLLQQSGIDVAIITARQSPIVAHRAKELGIARLLQGCTNKLAAMLDLAAELKLDPSQIAFMGDDLPDLAAMQRAGLAVAPANAHCWTADHAHWRTQRAGGQGAAREVADLILSAQGHVDACLERFQP
jgi:3-deoxy-D-manno-octulosonate 8-phosphate phosphatase (KDO 8-P phosphatase)